MALKLEIGNTYAPVPPEKQKYNRSGTMKKKHDWRLYAKVVQGDVNLIHQVTFQLHETFQPSAFKKFLPPFETRQQSYGPFTARVSIGFADGSSKHVEHVLVLHGDGARSTLGFQVSGNRLPAVSRPLATRPFGIELELTTSSQCSLDEVRNTLSRALKQVVVQADRSNRSSYCWKLVPDASVQCSFDERGACNPFELVSPKLCAGAGLSAANTVIRALHDQLRCSVRANDSTGFHVHVEVEGATLAQLKALCCAWVKYEGALDLLVDPSRRGDSNRYALSTRRNSHLFHLSNDAARDKLASAACFDELCELMNPGGSRYYKLNLQNLASGRQPTVEVRMHEGTADFQRVGSWVRLLVAFVEHAVSEADVGMTARPKTFAEGRTPQDKLAKLFEWVVKDRKLRDFYLSSACSSSCPSSGVKRSRCECECDHAGA
uniref:YEATS domain-containing protein n=1 Tax=Coccolithus braarudii TaxID=221442 RepID=A0A7S0Q6V5_9EUKA|mmetsp:Transcript_43596/g.92761  ORF Transcript_43596/g.92761 Transcript_43596/m.92761 type:complete len:434 (+) Transcript_43596:66-1367(+)